MKILPMYENRPGTKDLVHHTAKHFLDEAEGWAWDQVPAGGLTASEARRSLVRPDVQHPPTGQDADPLWWWPPWLEYARSAHVQGYAPRYLALIHLAGDPSGARWQAAAVGRRLAEFVGFRLILEPTADAFQVVTAYFAPEARGAGDLPKLAPALRAFAARKDCPPGQRSGVKAGETKP